MESFEWNNIFETNLKDVDKQHHHLVDIINRFTEHLTEGRIESKEIQIIFKELAEYADYHFKEEETLMSEMAIDERHIDFHILEHEKFLEEVNALQVRPSPDEIPALRLLMDFLINWLVYHILGVDQRMARQIHAVQSGISPAAAYNEDVDHKDVKACSPLVKALSRLLDLLTTRNRQLTVLNQSLEDMVSERTQELSEANYRLAELALTDPLTGLYNRRYAVHTLQTIWNEDAESGIGISCLMIDADNFKIVNDKWGHDVGDLVLKELSRTISYSLRTDDILCRMGGDEFLIICPNTGLGDGIRVAESILKTVNELKIPTGEESWTGSISIGVAEKTSEMTHHEEMIKASDDGVYLAKNYGRNCVKTIQV